MGGPSLALVRFLMCQYSATRWGEWGTVVIKVTIDLCMGGQLGVDAGTAEKIECDLSLWYKFIP